MFTSKTHFCGILNANCNSAILIYNGNKLRDFFSGDSFCSFINVFLNGKHTI